MQTNVYFPSVADHQAKKTRWIYLVLFYFYNLSTYDKSPVPRHHALLGSDKRYFIFIERILWYTRHIYKRLPSWCPLEEDCSIHKPQFSYGTIKNEYPPTERERESQPFPKFDVFVVTSLRPTNMIPFKEV